MTDMIKFEGATPIFRVEDLRASIDYYVNVLGFTVDWEYSNTIASVSRDRCCLFLCEREQGPPREDQPFGAWRDMHGDLWMPAPGGDGWTRLERDPGESRERA